MKKRLLVLFISLIATTAVSAQVPFFRVQWGVIGGVNVPNFSTSMDAAEIESKLGWQAGITMQMKAGPLGLEPQIMYVRNAFDMKFDGEDTRFVSNSIDVPVLISVPLFTGLKFYAGPVFTVYNEGTVKYNDGNSSDIGPIRPTMSYAVGAGVTLLRRLTVDVRYNGYFSNKDVKTPEGIELNDFGNHNVAVNLAIKF